MIEMSELLVMGQLTLPIQAHQQRPWDTALHTDTVLKQADQAT